MNKVYITRRETFNAAHKLWQPNWSEEKNNEVFGRCANKNWHGHNFVLYVTVSGTPDPESGFVMNLKDVKTKVLFFKNLLQMGLVIFSKIYYYFYYYLNSKEF